MTARAVTQAQLKRAILAARAIDPAAVVIVRPGEIVILPPGTVAVASSPDESGGNSCDGLFPVGS